MFWPGNTNAQAALIILPQVLAYKKCGSSIPSETIGRKIDTETNSYKNGRRKKSFLLS